MRREARACNIIHVDIEYDPKKCVSKTPIQLRKALKWNNGAMEELQNLSNSRRKEILVRAVK
jgi:hypothetical protein